MKWEYTCVLLHSCQHLVKGQRTRVTGGQKKQDYLPDQDTSNTRGGTRPGVYPHPHPDWGGDTTARSLRHHSTMCLMSLPHAVKQMQQPMRTSVPGSGERRTRKDHWQPSITPNLFNIENSPFFHGYVPPSYFGDKILLCNDSDNK